MKVQKCMLGKSAVYVVGDGMSPHVNGWPAPPCRRSRAVPSARCAH